MNVKCLNFFIFHLDRQSMIYFRNFYHLKLLYSIHRHFGAQINACSIRRLSLSCFHKSSYYIQLTIDALIGCCYLFCPNQKRQINEWGNIPFVNSGILDMLLYLNFKHAVIEIGDHWTNYFWVFTDNSTWRLKVCKW